MTTRSGTEALQRAVIARLKATGAIAELVEARVFDEPPSDKDKPATPYVYLGPVSRRRYEAGPCANTKAVTFRLFAVSTEFGRLQAWAVIEAVITALDNQQLAVEAPFSTAGDLVRSVQEGDVVQPLDPKSVFADFSVTLIRQGD